MRSRRVARTRRSGVSTAAPENTEVIGFKTGKGCAEESRARHKNDVVRGKKLVSPEQLTTDALRAVPGCGPADLAAGCNPEPAHAAAVGLQDHGHEASVNPLAGFEDPLVVAPTPDVLARPERLRGGALVATGHLRRPNS